MTISQRAIDVSDQHKLGKVGELVLADWFSEDRSAINSDPQAVAIKTVTVTGATAAKTYTVVIGGISVSYTAGGAPTTTTIAAGLAAAVEANPAVRGFVSPVAAVAVLTLTGLLAGEDFTLTEDDAELTTAVTQAAAEADAVPFGSVVCNNGVASTGESLCKIAKDTKFTAQVDSVQFAGLAAGDIATVTVIYDGVAYVAAAPFNTDNDTTVGDLRTEATTVLAALPLTVSGATDTIIVTADTAGDAFSTNAGHLGTLTSNKDWTTSAALSFLGLAIYSYDVEETQEYPANEGVSAMIKGRMWVENSQGVTQGDPVYVELDSGSADAGKLFNTSSATRTRLPMLTWHRAGPTADAIADIKLG